MQGLTFPTGKVYTRPDDKLMREVADLISKPSEVRELLAEDLFISEKIQTDRVAMMNHILPKACATDDILAQCRREKRSPTGEEQALIDEVEAIREMVIQVDSFDGLGQEINGQIPHWKTSDRPALQSPYPEEEIELKQASA